MGMSCFRFSVCVIINNTNWKHILKGWYLITGRQTLILVLMTLMMACGGSYKRDVDSYQGDGEISYIEGPLLGADGVDILMDKFDLSQEVDIDYDLDGIPPHAEDLHGYMMYLLIEPPIWKGLIPDDRSVTLTVFQDTNIVKKVTASFGQMITPSGMKGMHARYFMEFERSELKSSFFLYVLESERGTKYRINVKISASEITDYCPAHVYLKIGGYK